MFDTKMIEDLTQEDRIAAFAHLVKLYAGAVKIDEGDNWALPFVAEEIKAGCYQSITVCPYTPFQPRKLVILEPVVEIVEHDTITERKPVLIEKSKTWYGRDTSKVTEADCIVRTVEHRRFETLSRGIWDVTGAFVGQKMQFPSSANIVGSLFGPTGELLFKDKCEVGISITISVKNNSKQPARFCAVLLGHAEFAEVKPPFPTRLPSELDA